MLLGMPLSQSAHAASRADLCSFTGVLASGEGLESDALHQYRVNREHTYKCI